ncbi:MAG: DUF881 domain-containing protein [Propioniciclava sp.]
MPEPAPGPAPVTWREIGRDLLKPTRGQLIVGAILLVCGLALMMQLSEDTNERYSSLRQEELVSILDDVSAESRRLEDEVEALEATKRQLESGVDAREVAQAEAAKRLASLELLAGTVAVEGPGIRIDIYDPNRKLSTDTVLNAIEELRDAGAEALEINDEVRIVASTWVDVEDGTLTIDGQVLSGPYRLEAIGDPRTLSEASRFRGGLVSTIEGERIGGVAQVVEVEDLLIDSVHVPERAEFARPA